MRKLWIVALIALGVFLACGESSNAGSLVNGTQPAGKASQHFKVGDQVNVGNTYTVIVNSFKAITSQNQFEQPKAGNKYVSVDVTIKNTSSAEQTFSSMLSCTLRDSSGQQYNDTFIDGYNAPDGKVESGQQIKGQLVYEVPSATSAFTLGFVADITGGGQTIWDLSL